VPVPVPENSRLFLFIATRKINPIVQSFCFSVRTSPFRLGYYFKLKVLKIFRARARARTRARKKLGHK
jgi:hypothetical protein